MDETEIKRLIQSLLKNHGAFPECEQTSGEAP